MSRIYTTVQKGLVLGFAAFTIFMISMIAMTTSVEPMEPTTVHYGVLGDSFDVEYTEEDIIEHPNGPYRSTSLIASSYYFVTPNDPVLKKLYAAIEPFISEKDDVSKANYLCRFVYINYNYETDDEKHGDNEYFQYPSETILTGTGDCEDLAILLYNLYCLADLDAKLIHIDDHALVGVAVGGYGETITPLFSSKEYTFADPTNEYRIGESINTSGPIFVWTPTIIPITVILLIIGLAILLLYRIKED